MTDWHLFILKKNFLEKINEAPLDKKTLVPDLRKVQDCENRKQQGWNMSQDTKINTDNCEDCEREMCFGGTVCQEIKKQRDKDE